MVADGRSALCQEDVIVPLEHATETALSLIFQFLEYHDAHCPEDTVKLEDYDSATEAVMEIEAHRTFNTMWFGNVLQSGMDTLCQTVCAATYLSNPYLLRVLVSGTEQILLHGSAEHIRLFLSLDKDRDCAEGTGAQEKVEKTAEQQRILTAETQVENNRQQTDQADNARRRKRVGIKRKRVEYKENVSKRHQKATLSVL